MKTHHFHDLLLYDELNHARGLGSHISRLAGYEHHLEGVVDQHVELDTQARVDHIC
jgi:hypothetical protein